MLLIKKRLFALDSVWWQLRIVYEKHFLELLTLSWLRSLSYRNQSIDLHSKSMDGFLCDRDLRHERINGLLVSHSAFPFMRSFQFATTNATCCNSRDDFLHLSFILKISIFSETYLEPSRTSVMELLLRK